jgi:hypothetical protein
MLSPLSSQRLNILSLDADESNEILPTLHEGTVLFVFLRSFYSSDCVSSISFLRYAWVSSAWSSLLCRLYVRCAVFMLINGCSNHFPHVFAHFLQQDCNGTLVAGSSLLARYDAR